MMRELLARLFNKDHCRKTLKTKTYLLLSKDRQDIGLKVTNKIKVDNDASL
jgi:hypothetical protein